MVCLFHAGFITVAGTHLIERPSALGVLFNGHGAVLLFFVLSGAVLRLSLGAHWARETRSLATDFLIARLFRLYPVVIATVLVFALVMWARGTPTDPLHVLRNALLLEATMNGPFWSLQVEVVGSLLVLFAFLLERRFGLWIVAAIAAMIVPLSFLGSNRFIGPLDLSLLYTFLAGYLVAAVPWPPLSRGRLAAILGVSIVLFFTAFAIGNVLTRWLLMLTVVGAAGMVLVLSTESYRNRLSSTPLRLIGMWSYSFYALHGLACAVVQDVAHRMPAFWPPQLAGPVLLPLTIGVALLMAVPLYYLVERPGMKLGTLLRRRIRLVPARESPGLAARELG